MSRRDLDIAWTKAKVWIDEMRMLHQVNFPQDAQTTNPGYVGRNQLQNAVSNLQSIFPSQSETPVTAPEGELGAVLGGTAPPKE